ncbi:MAG: RidA family protein [Pseudomonadota bacterium]
MKKIVDCAGKGVDLCLVERPGLKELFLTALPVDDGGLEAQIAACARACREHGAAVIKMDLFGSREALDRDMGLVGGAFEKIDWPVMAISGEGCGGGGAAGLQVHAVAGVQVDTVSLDGRIAGRVFEDDFTRTCVLGNVHAGDGSAGREDQARRTFENLAGGLEQAGMTMKDVVRTWFFVSDILAWYGAFNAVRKAFYDEKGIMGGLLPASTGVGGENPGGFALVTAALAIRPRPGVESVAAANVPSPLQCPAPAYGSLFSRALEVSTPDRRLLIVSGTASIDPDGKTVHVGDVDGQIRLTLDVVRAILQSRGMDYGDSCRATVYFKKLQDAPRLEEFLGQYAVPAGRLVVARNEICRDDLLFEIEVDAVKSV